MAAVSAGSADGGGQIPHGLVIDCRRNRSQAFRRQIRHGPRTHFDRGVRSDGLKCFFGSGQQVFQLSKILKTDLTAETADGAFGNKAFPGNLFRSDAFTHVPEKPGGDPAVIGIFPAGGCF